MARQLVFVSVVVFIALFSDFVSSESPASSPSSSNATAPSSSNATSPSGSNSTAASPDSSPTASSPTLAKVVGALAPGPKSSGSGPSPAATPKSAAGAPSILSPSSSPASGPGIALTGPGGALSGIIGSGPLTDSPIIADIMSPPSPPSESIASSPIISGSPSPSPGAAGPDADAPASDATALMKYMSYPVVAFTSAIAGLFFF